SLLAYFIVFKKVNMMNRKYFLFIGALFLYISVYLFVFQSSNWMLMLYGVIIGFSYPIFNVPFVSLTYDIIVKARLAKELRVEYIIIREVFFNIGRIISIVLFTIGILLMEPNDIIPILLLTIGAGNLIAYFFVRKMNISFYLY